MDQEEAKEYADENDEDEDDDSPGNNYGMNLNDPNNLSGQDNSQHLLQI